MDSRLGPLLDDLLTRVSTLRLTRVYDPEDVTKISFSLDAVTSDGRRISVERDSPGDALLVMMPTAHPAGKLCRVCLVRKNPTHFSRSKSANTKDGRLPRCKVCERVRVWRYRQKSAVKPHELN